MTLNSYASEIENFYNNFDVNPIPEIISEDYIEKYSLVSRDNESENKLNSYVFNTEKGEKAEIFYSYPVKYIDASGNIKDKTIKFGENESSYYSEDSDINAEISKKYEEGYSVEIGGNKVNITPVWEEFSSHNVSTSMSEDEKIVFSYDNTSVEYSLSFNGIKENIILEAYEDKNSWKFFVNTNGLTLKEKYNQIVITDKEEVIMYFGEILCFSKDEKNNTIGNIEYKTIKENEEYLLTISVPEEWFLDENTQYPVKIDPTILVNYSGTSFIQDEILSETGSYSPYYDVIYVGKDSSGGKLRSIMNFSGLDFSGKTITSAYVEIRDVMCESNADLIECYEYTGAAWSESSQLSWNCASDYGQILDSHYVKWAGGNTSSDSQRYSFDITYLAQKWAAGISSPLQGIMFKATDEFENGNTNSHRSFASSNYGGNAQKPSLVITYVDPGGYISSFTSDSRTIDDNISVINYHNYGNLLALYNFDVQTKGFPLSLFYAYNSNENIWKLSLEETLTLDNGIYLYVDGYGTEYCFSYKSSGVYRSDALNAVLNISGQSAKLDLNDTVIRNFDLTTGKISSIKYEESTYSYVYDDSHLSSINKNGTPIFSLSYTSGKISSAFGYAFSYTEDVLTGIADKYGNIVNFTYTVDLNENITSFDIKSTLSTNGLYYTFDSQKRVTRAVKYRGNVTNNITDDTYSYGSGYTFTYSNLKNIDANNPSDTKTTYIFDYRGKTANKILSTYSGDVLTPENYRTDDFTAGNITGSGANNLIEDSSFETSVWSGLTKVQDDDAVMGNYVASLPVISSKQYSLGAGTYCFSAYVKGENAKASLSAYNITTGTNTSSKQFLCTDNWNRIYVTFTLTENQNVMLIINKSTQNDMFVDCLQLEKGESPTTYNLLTNSDFENGMTGWTGGTSSYYPIFDTLSCQIEAGANVYRTINLGGVSNEKSYTVSAWLFALTRLATSEIEITFNNSQTGKISLPFEGFSTEKQFLCVQFTAPESISSINSITITVKNTSDGNIICCDNILLSFGDISYSTDEYESENLSYISNGDGTCRLAGIGTCTDNDIVIAYKSPAGDIVTSIDAGAFQNNTTITSVDIPDGVTDIGANAFRNCTNLKTVVFGENVSEINSAAFAYCSALENISFNAELTFIDSVGFGYCTSLKSVSMPENFEKFGTYAFCSCSALEMITIPKTCSEISANCFIGTNSSLKIYYEESSSDWNDITIGTDAIPASAVIVNNCEVSGDNICHFTYSGSGISSAEIISLDDGETVYEYRYDSNGNITYCRDETGNETTYTYDANGNLLSYQSNGKTVTYTYNNKGDLASETDENGNTTSYSYYPNGLLFTVTRGDSFIAYSYTDDLLSNVTIYGSNTRRYVYSYNNYGNLTGITLDGSTICAYSYTCNGRSNIRSKQESNGYITYYVYDSLGNVLSVSDKSQNTYDKAGTILKTADIALNTTKYYIYSPDRTCTSYIFDENNNLIQTEIYDGTVVLENGNTYTGMPENVSAENEKDEDAGEETYILNLVEDNEKTAILTITKTYLNDTGDLQEEIQEESFSDGNIFEYTYDNCGNLTQVKEKASENDEGTIILKYKYDSKYELVREDNYYANDTYCFTYDNNGNILTKKTYDFSASDTLGNLRNTITYTYGNTIKDLLTCYNGTNISYSGLNPLNWRNAVNMSWQGRQLAGLTLNDNTNIVYSYDGEGIRTEKTVGNVTTEFVLKDGNILLQDNGTEIIEFYYDGDEIIGFNVNSENYFYGKDNFGVIRFIYDENGDIICTYGYDAWGRVLSVAGSDTQVGNLNPIRYKGYYYDCETGFYYLQSRYYDPTVGRFINGDDTTFLGATETVLSWNLFIFCENDVVMKIDIGGYAAVYVVGLSVGNGIPIVGHAVLYYYRDDNNKWYRTEFAGPVTYGIVNSIVVYGIAKHMLFSGRKLLGVGMLTFIGCATADVCNVSIGNDFSSVMKDVKKTYSKYKCLCLPEDYSYIYNIALNEKSRNPHFYSLIYHNCAHYVESLLLKSPLKNVRNAIHKKITPIALYNSLLRKGYFKIYF